MNKIRDRFRGCLLGGAVGDALGAPVEFMSLGKIQERFGTEGIGDYVPAYGRTGAITDDTQMTLFTAEGMLRAHVRGRMRGLTTFSGVTDHAYLRWLETQGHQAPIEIGRDGWLWQLRALHHLRAPGNTCLSALRAKQHFGEAAANQSKGCGGVMRVAPVGLYAWHQRAASGHAEEAFHMGAEIAGLTHGHPSGRYPAGVLALLILRSLDGIPLAESMKDAKGILRTLDQHQETLAAIEAAERLATSGAASTAITVESLGEGWVAEEALAISLYCTLVAADFEHGMRLAVNHGGDSDSTGAITGNLLGALRGESSIPRRWIKPLELAPEITQIADDLLDCPAWNIGEHVESGDNERIWARYPGW